MLMFLLFLTMVPSFCVLMLLFIANSIMYFLKPKLHRDWDSLHELLPQIIYYTHNQELFVKNIRNTKYNPIFEFENKVEYLNKRYNLKDLEKLWLFVNPYGPFQSHVILSFQFGAEKNSASFLTLSYELRKTKSEEFDIKSTLFKMFEGYYLLATEEDVFYVRTNVRKDTNCYLYELNIPKNLLHEILLEYVKKINSYSQSPYRYKILGRNCLTEIFNILKGKKVLRYNFLDYLSINYLLFKNYTAVVTNTRQNYEQFLQTHKIHNCEKLNSDSRYSINIRL